MKKRELILNPLKAGLRQRHLQLGLWCSLGSPISTEVVAGSGFDWLLLDMEHSPNDLRDIYGQLQAVMEHATQAVVRVPSDDAIQIKRILDAGALTLMIPNIEDAEQARRAVAATRYPPKGIRGFSQAPRATRFGRVADYHARCDAEICVVAQIESQRALDNIEAIAAIDDVDALFIGPGDLSASLGYLGQQNHPEFVPIVENAIRRIVATGKAAGILTSDEPMARRYIAAGSLLTAVGSDAGLLARQSEQLVDRFR